MEYAEKLFVCFSFLSPERRSEVVLEEKLESSLVKNVSFAGHVQKEKALPDTPVDAPQGQHCTSHNANDSSLDCNKSITKPVKCKGRHTRLVPATGPLKR